MEQKKPGVISGVKIDCNPFPDKDFSKKQESLPQEDIVDKNKKK